MESGHTAKCKNVKADETGLESCSVGGIGSGRGRGRGSVRGRENVESRESINKNKKRKPNPYLFSRTRKCKKSATDPTSSTRTQIPITSPQTNNALGNPRVTPSPHQASSIRNTARKPTESNGLQSNNRYQLNYFREQNQKSKNNNPRICVCDNYLIPPDCPDCKIETMKPCPYHKSFVCSILNCTKKFHMGCMANMSHMKFDAFDYSKFVCMECRSRISDPVFTMDSIAPK